RGNVLIECALLRRHQRTFCAQPHAANALGAATVVQSPLGNFFVESVLDALTLARQTARRYADVDAMLVASPFRLLGLGYLFQFLRSHEISIGLDGPAWFAASPSRRPRGHTPQPAPSRTNPGTVR